jgi:hypothetical protein
MAVLTPIWTICTRDRRCSNGRFLKNNNTVTEQIGGGGGLGAWTEGPVQVGVSGYRTSIQSAVQPWWKTRYSNARAYRGDGCTLVGNGCSMENETSGDLWASWPGPGLPDRKSVVSGGPAWTGTLLWGAHPLIFGWGYLIMTPILFLPTERVGVWSLGWAGKFAAKPDRGGFWVGEWVKGSWRGRVNVTLARFPEAKATERNTDPIAPPGPLFWRISNGRSRKTWSFG